jgi:hypothetical protein
MGLPVSQRRNLDEIEDSLRVTDPRLVSLFTIFTRLNRDEEMPRIEQLKAGAAGLWAWLRIRPAAAIRWLAASSGARFRTAVFFPIALAAMACTMLLGMGSSGSHRCVSAPRAVGTSQLTTKPGDKVRIRAAARTGTAARTGAGASTKAIACSPALWPDGMMGR